MIFLLTNFYFCFRFLEKTLQTCSTNTINTLYNPFLSTSISNEKKEKEKNIWPSVCPGVGSTCKLCLPKHIWSSGFKSISALAPLLRDIIDWQPGNKHLSLPVPVIWSACICVFTAKGIYPYGERLSVITNAFHWPAAILLKIHFNIKILLSGVRIQSF